MTTRRVVFSCGAEVLEDLLGFRPEPTRRSEIETAVHGRLQRRGLEDLHAYAQLLADPQQRIVEARALADLATINETYFLREAQHYDVLRDTLVPRFRAEPSRGPLQVLSLGCSTGEEPYSIALTLREAGLGAGEARVHAVDASPAVIARAERGHFSPWSMRNVSDAMRTRYFVHEKGGYTLSEQVRNYVRFEVRNALDADESFWQHRRFDAVFCRNLLIYLTPQAARSVIERCAQILEPEGLLLLGHSETSHASKLFAVRQAHGCFYFVRQAAAPQSGRATAKQGGGFDSITRRIRPSLRSPAGAAWAASRSTHESKPSEASTPSPEFWQLWREEKFTKARALLARLPETSELALLRAALLMHEARLDEARAACTAILAVEPASPGAHHLLGLVGEHQGDLHAAAQHHLRAAALDPDFAVAILRAGMLCRRLGDRLEARRLLRAAIRLLPYQSDHSLLLFGGGFAAEGLISLCRSELSACEGNAND